jgi:hypothetical protein
MKYYKYCLALFYSFSIILFNPVFAADISKFVETLGKPFKKYYKDGEDVYARNVWDLQVYKDLIFIGAGNSSNRGPAKNSGPVAIIYYDTNKKKFIREGKVNEEQIDLFRVINNQLYIPGHDPLDSWKLGNFYQRLNSGNWIKYRNIPKALHSSDLIKYNNKLFLALGLKNGAAISISKNNGKKWKNIAVGRHRVYRFLKVANNLYVTKKIKRKSYQKRKKYSGIYAYKEPNKLIPRPDLSYKIMFPDINLSNQDKRIIRPNSIGSKAIYIGAYIHNGIQSEPFGVFVTSSLEKNHTDIKRIKLPKKSIPWDILVKDKFVYLLLSKNIKSSWFFSRSDKEGKNTEVMVMRAPRNNLMQWKTLFSFKSSTFARSFEMLNGDFYFGMGTEVKHSKKWKLDELKPEAGNILRIKKQFILKG